MLYVTFITCELYIEKRTLELYNAEMNTLLLQSPSQLPLHLKSLRKSRKMTQADMAKRLHITQERYSKMERNPQLIATGRLLEILGHLGVDVLLKLRPPESSRMPTSTPTPTRRGEDW